MRKTVFFVLVFISSILLLARVSISPISKLLNVYQRAGIRIESIPSAKVFINGQEMGDTPFQKEDLQPMAYALKVVSEKGQWQGNITLNAGTLTVVNRELDDNNISNAGEVITLEKGGGVMFVSNPPQADVEVDGKVIGKTPIFLKDITAGEHQFLISRNGYIKRSIRSVVTEGFRLKVAVDLSLGEVDTTQTFTPPTETKTNTKLKVLETPTDFLNVRASPNTSATIVVKLEVGDVVELIEDLNSWKKIQTSDGKQGYVSGQYVQVVE